MLGSFVVLYLFLGGCGAGVLLVVSLWSVARSARAASAPQSQLADRAFCVLRGRLEAIAFLILTAAALCLLLDLGRPERFYLLFVRPTPSLISLGSFVLGTCWLVAGALALADGAGWHLGCRRRRCLEAAAAALSVAMMVYTGLYMAFLEAVPLWNNPALPVLLACSSASSGLAIVLLAAPFGWEWQRLAPALERVHRIHGWVLLAELAALGTYGALAAANPFAGESLATLVAPQGLGPWFVGVFGVAGVLVPLAAEGLRRPFGAGAVSLGVEALCIVGGLILRFCLVLAGSH